MIRILFILAFLLCSAIALGCIWMGRQTIVTYDSQFHKKYFYYLVFFYAYAFYALWGPFGLRELMLFGGMQPETVNNTARWLPVLALPFAGVGWLLYSTLGFALAGFRKVPGHTIGVVAMAGLMLPVVWIFGYLNAVSGDVSDPAWPLVLAGAALWPDFISTAFVVGALLLRRKKSGGRPNRYAMRFAWGVALALILRIVGLGLITRESFLAAPGLLVYFLSAALPFLFSYRVSDRLFQPVFPETTHKGKLQHLIETYGITPREQDVIEKICEGKTNRQIADELFISLQTVKDHTHRIYSKVGINSRLKLVQLLNG